MPLFTISKITEIYFYYDLFHQEVGSMKFSNARAPPISIPTLYNFGI